MTMSALRRLACLVAILPAPFPCAAQAYKAWTVQCDNVNRCEAVGYAPQRETGRWLAIRLVREAGPAMAVEMKIVLSWDGPRKPGVLAVAVGKHRPVAIQANQPIPRYGAYKLLGTLIEGRAGRASDGREQWTLPLAGMKAALLRMDAVQGRVGTPGALVRRGNRPEAAVPPAPAMPVLRAVAPAEPVDDRDIKAALLAAIDPADEDAAGPHRLHRFPDGRLLLLREVSGGGTTALHEVWLANREPPYQPRKLGMPASGTAEETLFNASFDGQVLDSFSGKILSDCRQAAEWLWTGEKFELLALYQPDDCRGMLGMIEHRKWVARKVPWPPAP